MSALTDRMMDNLFNDDFSYLDMKLAPVITRTVESKADAAIQVSQAQAKQIEMSTMLDSYRDFVRAVQAINALDDTLVSKDQIIKDLAKAVGIAVKETATNVSPT